eukprot:760842-Hanusia_phi.AAC.1
MHPSPNNMEQVDFRERFRSVTLTDDCLLLMGQGWEFFSCDVYCLDGVAVYAVQVRRVAERVEAKDGEEEGAKRQAERERARARGARDRRQVEEGSKGEGEGARREGRKAGRTLEDVNSSFTDCVIGAPTYLDQPDNEGDRQELAYMGVRMEGDAVMSIVRSVIQKTQLYGIKLDEKNELVLLNSTCNKNGCMGGASLAMSRYASCICSSCFFNGSISYSALFRHTAAFEAKVSARAGARLQLRNSTIVGRQWLSYHRPMYLEEEDVSLLPFNLSFKNVFESGWEQAKKAKMKDPVLVSGDSYHEVWWPRSQLEKANLEEGGYPEDGYGTVRGYTDFDYFYDDVKEVKIVLNASKEVILYDWGWEGTMEDAFDTDSPDVRGLHDRKWQWREDLTQQVYDKEMWVLRKMKKRWAEERASFVSHFAQLMNASSRSQSLPIIRSIVNESPQCDLASDFWLRKKLEQEEDEEVRRELQAAIRNISVQEDDLRLLIGQYRGCKLDAKGDPVTPFFKLGRYRIKTDFIPSYVRAAVWPFYPIYPQFQGELQKKLTASSYHDPAASPLHLHTEDGSQLNQEQEMKMETEDEEDEEQEEQEEQEQGQSKEGQAPIMEDTERWMNAPWFEGVEFLDGQIAPLAVDVTNETQVQQLSCEDRIQLAQQGFLPFPSIEEMEEEEKNKPAKEFFQMISAPEWNPLIVPAFWDYADKMRVTVPNGTALKAERRRLTKELELTKKYFEALELSTALHLEEDEWKNLYPQLDPDKLFDPPSERKLQLVYDRICMLKLNLTMAVNNEKFALMSALYPLAQEVEEAFKTHDREKIEKLASRHKNYNLNGKIADGLLEFPYSMSPDGNYVLVEKRLKKQFDILRRVGAGGRMEGRKAGAAEEGAGEGELEN